ncbi:hypothetical protein B0H67DRAFT_600653 [Lasiosphaeris hirsuta]|uniref:Cns1/TTC4 wheel domain-containing protein n=1 Tax=Lasiosphaeris hirsuta TaxID=260670 RepID=A0AA40AFG2_9PEZI|nr:hypothetical protein B0H67DRAFT_600653 [Lasiosphaeris hirsuta]
MPALPPGLNNGLTIEETLADMKSHPIFMTELAGDLDSEDNPDLIAALQALAYEGTPLENAANFKEQGNESFKAKRWADAKEFYAKGIVLLAAEERRRAGPPADPNWPAPAPAPAPESPEDPAEIKAQRVLLEALYVNRAACHLSLRNYRSCTLDCAATLRLNPTNIKALYRSARALLLLDKIPSADDACALGLSLDPKNASLQAVATDIIARATALDAKRNAEQARLAKVRSREALLQTALRARGIRMRATSKPPEMEDALVQLVPDPDDPHSALVFPTILLYPAHLESDFIKAFNETECLEQHFGYVFPLPWDREGAYVGSNVECYMETSSGGLVKVGRKVPLLKVLAGGNVEVVDNSVKVFVVPKAKAEAWVKGFKEKKALERGEVPKP